MKDLESIFKIIAWPFKTLGPPSKYSRLIRGFGEREVVQAIRFFGSLGLSPETKVVRRYIHLYRESAGGRLELVEIPYEQKPKRDSDDNNIKF